MGMTSVVLVILAVSVRAVAWVDAQMRRRELEREARESELSKELAAPEPESTGDQDEARARAAAIAVALALSQRQNEPGEPSLGISVGVATPAVHDTWLAEGRSRQHASRGGSDRTRDWR